MEHSDYLAMIEDICTVDEGLTAWEMDFIDSVFGQAKEFTPKQQKVITDIYLKVLG